MTKLFCQEERRRSSLALKIGAYLGEACSPQSYLTESVLFLGGAFSRA